MSDQEIVVTGIETLNKALGPVGALRFLILLRREPTDIEEIFEKAGKHWKG